MMKLRLLTLTLTIATQALMGFTEHQNLSENGMRNDVLKTVSPPARDGQIAIGEEYRTALRLGTVEALELFIARHPNNVLTENARSALRRLSR